MKEKRISVVQLMELKEEKEDCRCLFKEVTIFCAVVQMYGRQKRTFDKW